VRHSDAQLRVGRQVAAVALLRQSANRSAEQRQEAKQDAHLSSFPLLLEQKMRRLCCERLPQDTRIRFLSSIFCTFVIKLTHPSQKRKKKSGAKTSERQLHACAATAAEEAAEALLGGSGEERSHL
jgi:hypothetical protein